jgi:hypothetical protein
MRVEVIQLMFEGKRLSREELERAPRFFGNLVMDWWTEGNAFKRPIQRVRLKGLGHGTPPDLIAPIFEPALEKVTDDRMVIRGVQVVAASGQTQQVAQEWMLRPREQE